MPTSKKILIAEDDPQHLKLLKDFLTVHGFEVISAVTGQEALDCVRNGVPDLVMVDIILPEINGWKVCQMLKSDVRCRHVPIILMSVLLNEDVQPEQGMESADVHLSKPIDLNKLLKIIDRLTGAGEGNGLTETRRAI